MSELGAPTNEQTNEQSAGAFIPVCMSVVRSMSVSIPSSLSDYVGDWRFWLVVILALSFIASFVTTFNR